MTPQHKARVAQNADYHQQMADHYEALDVANKSKAATENGTANGRRSRAAAPEQQHTAEEEYLANLHADVAQQLRAVLQTSGAPPEILGTTPPVTRQTGVARRLQ